MSNKRYATRSFNDAGTGKSFAVGDEVTGTDGEIANYEAAGLLGTKAEAGHNADVAELATGEAAGKPAPAPTKPSTRRKPH